MPNPQPWTRGGSGNAEFFTSNPACHNDRGFFSYGQFWQAHQPIKSRQPTLTTVSSSFWPFGQGITSVTGSERKEDLYCLDGRLIDRTAPHMPRSRSLCTVHKRSYQSDRLESEFGLRANVPHQILGPSKYFQEIEEDIVEDTKLEEDMSVRPPLPPAGRSHSFSGQSGSRRSSTATGRYRC